jgi:hypothetical protein
MANPASPSRRSILKAAGAAAVASFAAPNILRGEEAGSKIILGTGEHKFECTHEWLAPPENSGIVYGDTHGLCQDSQGRIYLSHTVHPSATKKDGVLVFDADGKFIKSFGPEYAGGSHGLDVRKEPDGEFLYHCDTNRNIFCKTDLDGKVIWSKGRELQSEPYKDGKIGWKPTNVAFAPNGDFYVSDGYGSGYILQYNIKGDFIRTIGTPGNGQGQFAQPHGLWVDDRDKANPTLAVADRANRRIQYMTLDGKFIKFVTEGMRLPCHFSVDYKRELLLVPDLDFIVTILDKDNKVVGALGDGKAHGDLRGQPREKFHNGEFVHPHDAIFLANGDIVVCEWLPIGRVTHLRRVG